MKQYIRKTRLVEVLKWLRGAGTRGVDWEFSGGKSVTIEFRNPDLETAYIMMWEWANPD